MHTQEKMSKNATNTRTEMILSLRVLRFFCHFVCACATGWKLALNIGIGQFDDTNIGTSNIGVKQYRCAGHALLPSVETSGESYVHSPLTIYRVAHTAYINYSQLQPHFIRSNICRSAFYQRPCMRDNLSLDTLEFESMCSTPLTPTTLTRTTELYRDSLRYSAAGVGKTDDTITQ